MTLSKTLLAAALGTVLLASCKQAEGPVTAASPANNAPATPEAAPDEAVVAPIAGKTSNTVPDAGSPPASSAAPQTAKPAKPAKPPTSGDTTEPLPGDTREQCNSTFRFDRGAVSDTLRGSVAGTEICPFHFTAKQGQKLTTWLQGDRALDVILYSPVEATLVDGEAYTLPKSGTYEIRVLQNRNAARNSTANKPFALKLQILDGKPVATTPAPVRYRLGEDDMCSASLVFPRGANQTNVKSSMRAGDYCEYRVRASAGQTLDIQLDSLDGVPMTAKLASPVDKPVTNGVHVVLPRSGVYALRVMSPPRADSDGEHHPFDLNIRIR